MKKIIVYTKDYCPFCVRAKELLSSKGVSFEEIRIDLHPEKKESMIEKTGDKTTVPQIFIDDFHVGGCDDLYEAEKQGRLDRLLELDKKEDPAEHGRVVIMGSGPAGYTAAIYLGRADAAPLIISGPQKGGQLTTTTQVDNFPGFAEGVDGNELMNQMEKQALRFGARIVFGEITKVDLSQHPFKLYQDNKLYTCDALIIATGASARYLGLESETRFKNRGVSACATCDGFFFRGQKVAVVGGGDVALEEAFHLAKFCEKVFLIHRRDEFRASKAMQERIFQEPKIEAVWDSVADEVIGDDIKGMTDLRIKNLKTGEKRNLGVSGMFVAIGHSPSTALFEGALDMDKQKYLTVRPGSSKTNIEGVFACGDATDKVYRQAITAAGSGCVAAIDAERWLAARE